MSLERRINFDKVYEYGEKGIIGKEEFTSFFERMPLLEKALRETEEASGLQYPPVLFEPALTIIRYPSSTFSGAVIYASCKLMEYKGELQPCVVFSVPFVILSSEDVLRACAVHEFLHYIYITKVLSKGNYMDLAGERLDSIEVHQAYDETHTVPPGEWIRNAELVELVKKIFNPNIDDPDLEAAIREKWIEKGLPVKYTTAEEAKLKIPIEEIQRVRLDMKVLQRLAP
ncbi:MAG: hypothetical protein QFX34_00170 [Candidatus Verstraetearchaeota archaeon]|nr:hypothetical protein [Candidatus Verstraetearchaeota archaeon]